MSIKNGKILRFGFITEDKYGRLVFENFHTECDGGGPHITLLKLVAKRINSEIAKLEEKGDE